MELTQLLPEIEALRLAIRCLLDFDVMLASIDESDFLYDADSASGGTGRNEKANDNIRRLLKQRAILKTVIAKIYLKLKFPGLEGSVYFETFCFSAGHDFLNIEDTESARAVIRAVGDHWMSVIGDASFNLDALAARWRGKSVELVVDTDMVYSKEGGLEALRGEATNKKMQKKLAEMWDFRRQESDAFLQTAMYGQPQSQGRALREDHFITDSTACEYAHRAWTALGRMSAHSFCDGRESVESGAAFFNAALTTTTLDTAMKALEASLRELASVSNSNGNYGLGEGFDFGLGEIQGQGAGDGEGEVAYFKADSWYHLSYALQLYGNAKEASKASVRSLQLMGEDVASESDIDTSTLPPAAEVALKLTSTSSSSTSSPSQDQDEGKGKSKGKSGGGGERALRRLHAYWGQRAVVLTLEELLRGGRTVPAGAKAALDRLKALVPPRTPGPLPSTSTSTSTGTTHINWDAERDVSLTEAEGRVKALIRDPPPVRPVPTHMPQLPRPPPLASFLEEQKREAKAAVAADAEHLDRKRRDEETAVWANRLFYAFIFLILSIAIAIYSTIYLEDKSISSLNIGAGTADSNSDGDCATNIEEEEERDL